MPGHYSGAARSCGVLAVPAQDCRSVGGLAPRYGYRAPVYTGQGGGLPRGTPGQDRAFSLPRHTPGAAPQGESLLYKLKYVAVRDEISPVENLNLCETLRDVSVTVC